MKHTTILVTLLISTSLLAQGCASRDWQQALKSNQKLQCQKLPPAEYNDCINQIERSFQDYDAGKREPQ